MPIEAVAALDTGAALSAAQPLGVDPALVVRADLASGADFGSVLMAGLRTVDRKIATANDLVRQFALDDDIPVHQVTFALEEARMSMELAMQVRARLVESYRDLMAMQL